MGKFLLNVFACFILSYFILGIFGILSSVVGNGLFPMMVVITVVLMGIGKFINYIVDLEDKVRTLELDIEEMKGLLKKAE